MEVWNGFALWRFRFEVGATTQALCFFAEAHSVMSSAKVYFACNCCRTSSANRCAVYFSAPTLSVLLARPHGHITDDIGYHSVHVNHGLEDPHSPSHNEVAL